MDTLYSWSARRSGGRITIDHSCGKIANIDVITFDGNRLIAIQASGPKSDAPPGRIFTLHVPEGTNPVGHALQQMQKPEA